MVINQHLMNVNRLFLIFLFSLLILVATAQKKDRFGAGISYDNIYGGGTLILELKTFKGHLIFNPEFSDVKYGNFAMGVSISYSIFDHNKKDLLPFFGITITRSFGGEFSYEEGFSNGKDLTFESGVANYLIPHLGVKYDLIKGAFNAKGNPSKSPITLFSKIGYKFILGDVPTVVKTGGEDINNRMKTAQKYLNSRFVYSLGIIICW